MSSLLGLSFIGFARGQSAAAPYRATNPATAAALEPDQAGLQRFAAEAFAAYFLREENLDDPAVLAAAATAAAHDGSALLAAAATDPVKARLRSNTEELIERGGFGSPSMFVGGKLFFGNDQLPVVEQELLRSAP